MKVAIAGAMLVALCAVPASAQRSTRVGGHVRSDGVYVQPHMRTTPNSTATDNWSTRGNVNPYTGRAGTVDPYAPKAPSWQPKTTPRPRGY